MWVVVTVMWRVVETGIWGGVGFFAYFAKQGEFWERVEGELVLQGNPHIVVCPFLAELFRGMLFKWKGENKKSHQK